ncbi:hypothetical protein C0V77_16925 [Emticicia sp. TH156]|nr:hypothetical protein C0V77_16925 [Emticicia sp. TH156]
MNVFRLIYKNLLEWVPSGIRFKFSIGEQRYKKNTYAKNKPVTAGVFSFLSAIILKYIYIKSIFKKD